MKKTISAVFAVALLVLGWYLFLKPHDYTVRIKAKTSPGTAYEMVKFWNNKLVSDSIQSAITSEDAFNSITQQLQLGDSIIGFTWKFSAENDSVSKITLHLSDKANSVKNKLSVLTGNSAIKKIAVSKAKAYKGLLESHLEGIRVTFIGENETTPAQTVAYVSLEGPVHTKAFGMMEYYNLLSDFVATHNLVSKGVPFVEVTRWDLKTNRIQYDFCFPIANTDSLPQSNTIKFKKVAAKKALKAEYNGNYKTSDRGWYFLHEYAKQRGLSVKQTPIEYFYNNPNYGGDELNWKAEVYLPLE